MDSFFRSIIFPFVFFDRTCQKMVDLAAFQIMRTTGCGKSKIRFFINALALFSGLGLTLTLYVLTHYHAALLALLSISGLRVLGTHFDYKNDLKAEYVGARSIVDLKIMADGWKPRVWFWFVLFMQFYIQSKVPTFKTSFFVFYDAYLTSWLLVSYFAHTPPTPPPTKHVVPARLATNTSS